MGSRRSMRTYHGFGQAMLTKRCSCLRGSIYSLLCHYSKAAADWVPLQRRRILTQKLGNCPSLLINSARALLEQTRHLNGAFAWLQGLQTWAVAKGVHSNIQIVHTSEEETPKTRKMKVSMFCLFSIGQQKRKFRTKQKVTKFVNFFLF